MNKTAIKNFAIWARNKLIADISYKAGLLGITEKGIKSPLPQSTQTVQFFDIGTKEPSSITGIEIQQRKKLVEEIERKAKQSDYATAYKNVIEEVAYTWFNRLIAIRFMEVNNYLPTRIRVLSSEGNGKAEPDLVTHALEANLDYSAYEKDRIVQLKHENKLDELFRMLFIKQCNTLNSNLPELFEKTSDFTELLLNVSFTDKEGIVYHLVNDLDEDDFNVSKEGQVEVIGWLYQYYNTEPKEETFALLKKKVKITKERIPSATQLFTPDWIVRYMVENSLGRLWIEGHPNDELKKTWKYYIDETTQDEQVTKTLNKIRIEYGSIKPEDIKVFDPAMGSGHILVYAFDVLIQIYQSFGYNQREASKSIVENNLFGVDIDKRAYQLAYFAIMMKARQYNRKILDGHITCNVNVIEESNNISKSQLKYFGYDLNEFEKNTALLQIQGLIDSFVDAKEFGSIIEIEDYDWDLLRRFTGRVESNGQLSIDTLGIENTKKQLSHLVFVGETLAQKYDVVITNPPYAGRRNLGSKICDYLDSNFRASKMDLFSAFIEKNISFTKNNGFIAFMTPFVWLFLTSYTDMRKMLLNTVSMDSLIQPEEASFQEAAVSICTFVLRKRKLNYNGTYIKLSQFHDPREQETRALEAINNDVDYRYVANMSSFEDLPDSRFIYWAGDALTNAFKTGRELGKVCQPRQGMATTNNDLFLRLWFEVDIQKVGFDHTDEEDALASSKKWFPYNKGGGFRKWYGNYEYLVNFENNGKTICNYIDNTPGVRVGSNGRVINRQYFFKKSITWSDICGNNFAARACPVGFIFDVKGSSAFVSKKLYLYILAFLNSRVCVELLNSLNPTITTQVGDLKQLPFIDDANHHSTINELTESQIYISKSDWDSFETSWDFHKHPLITGNSIKDAYAKWENIIEDRFKQLKENEIRLNNAFIDIYELHDDLAPEVEDRDITISSPDLTRDIKSFISYAVGCMFGRYSLDEGGLIFAGGDWNIDKYINYIPDKDNILPITDEEYFIDDIVGRFVEFIETVYGSEHIEENLNFIANALGGKDNSSREIIRNYFLKDFYKDHCKIYQKRPIYWLFDSGKQNGFKALIYMHRYDENTIGNLRVDYLHRMQRIYENEIARMQDTIENSRDAREVTAANKRKEKLIKQLQETKEYDEKIAHLALARTSIDLDDGVKVNYEKIQTDQDGKKLDVLAKI